MKGMQREKSNKREVRGVKGWGGGLNRGEQGEVHPTLKGGITPGTSRGKFLAIGPPRNVTFFDASFRIES